MKRSTADIIVAFGLTMGTLLLLDGPSRADASTMPSSPAVTVVAAAASS